MGRGWAPLTWASASQHGWRSTAEASLGLRLLRKRREHAQVGKVFDVVVAGPLGGVSGHGQHVLEHFALTGLLVGVLAALLAMVLALPLGPDL